MLSKIQACKNIDVGILLVRIAVGVAFIAHGWQKFQGMEGVVAFFGTLGLPAFVAYLVMLVELLGGIAILLGFFVQYAGILVAIVVAFAILLVKGEKGFLGGYELEFTLMLAGLSLLFTGAGKYTLGKKKNSITS